MKHCLVKIIILISVLLTCTKATLADDAFAEQDESDQIKKELQAKTQIINLQECIDIALKNNRHRLISKASVDVAEFQHKQAKSAYWPQLNLEVSATRMDENPNFIFPSRPLPLGSIATPLAEAVAGTQLAKMGITPDSVGLDAYNQALGAATQSALQGLEKTEMPAQDVTLMDRDTLLTSFNLLYPLYTGGKSSSIVQQAKIGVQAAKEESRRTDLQIISDVKKYYYGSILSKKLLKLGQETLERFEVTLELTETLYKHGSGRVKKTDYLRTQVVVASIRSLVELLKSNEAISRSALANTMGLNWRMNINLSEDEIPFTPYTDSLEQLVADAYQLNPQLMQINLGLDASEAKIKEAKAGHLPIFVLFGKVSHIENSLDDAGLITDENKNSWALGIRMDFPIFNGFRTVNKINEAKAQREKMKQQKILLKEGVALQIKDAFLQIARAQGQVRATEDALSSAVENRELNVRAYRDELVETKDVIQAQLIEFFIHGQYLKALYDNQLNQSNLEFLIGKSLYETI